MSAVEFALKPKTPFIHTLPQLPFENSMTGSDVLTARYEGLCRLSRSIASIHPSFSRAIGSTSPAIVPLRCGQHHCLQ